MRTYPLTEDSGAIIGFQVSNAFLSPREIARLVKSALGASITAGPQGYASSGEMRLRFRYAGTEFEVFEPFGNNSRYWIFPAAEKPVRVPEMDRLHELFRAYRPSLLRRMVSALGG
jgi:hypothetical protein